MLVPVPVPRAESKHDVIVFDRDRAMAMDERTVRVARSANQATAELNVVARLSVERTAIAKNTVEDKLVRFMSSNGGAEEDDTDVGKELTRLLKLPAIDEAVLGPLVSIAFKTKHVALARDLLERALSAPRRA